jgi:hypothetical protein
VPTLHAIALLFQLGKNNYIAVPNAEPTHIKHLITGKEEGEFLMEEKDRVCPDCERNVGDRNFCPYCDPRPDR